MLHAPSHHSAPWYLSSQFLDDQCHTMPHDTCHHNSLWPFSSQYSMNPVITVFQDTCHHNDPCLLPSQCSNTPVITMLHGPSYHIAPWSQGTRERRSEKQHLWTIIINSTSLPYSTSFKQLTSVNLNTNSGRFSSLKSLIFHPKHPPMYCEDESGPPAPSPTAQPSCLRRQPPLVGTLHQILR